MQRILTRSAVLPDVITYSYYSSWYELQFFHARARCVGDFNSYQERYIVMSTAIQLCTLEQIEKQVTT